MTATKLSPEKTPIVTAGYVKYSIKRAWAVALLIFIAFFFLTSVATMMRLDTREEYYDRYSNNGTVPSLITEEEIEQRIEREISRVLNEVVAATGVITVCAALFAGCFTLSFLHNKVSAGFFHSLPEKRVGHFIAALSASLAVYIVPLLANTLILAVVFMVRGLFYGYVFALIAELFIGSLFYYTAFLAIVFFAGVLTGSTAIHVLFSCYIPLVLPVIFLSLTMLLEVGVSYLYCDPFDWLVSLGGFITPIARYIILLDAMTSIEPVSFIGYLIFDVFLTAAFLYFAYRIYEKRPIERAGTPIIYKPVGEAVKYSVMLPAVILASRLFTELGGGGFWLVFGAVTGAVLSLMLMNTILARSAKAMFTHMKGFAVFCGATLAVYIIFVTGIFGYADYHVPFTDEISISVDGHEAYTLKGDEAKALRSYMKELNQGIRSGKITKYIEYQDFDHVTVYDEDGIPKTEPISYELNEYIAKGEDMVRRASIYVNYKGLFGLTAEYRYYNFPYSDVSDVIALIATSESYKNEIVPEGSAITYLNIDMVCPSSVVDKLGLFDEYKKYDADLSENIGKLGYTVRIDFNVYGANDVNAFLKSKEYESINREFCLFLRNRSSVLTTEPSVGSFSYEINNTPNGTARGIDVSEGYWGSSPIYASDVKALLSIIDKEGVGIDLYVRDEYSGHEFSLYASDSKLTVFKSLKSALSACALDDYIDDKVNTVASAVIIDHSKGEVTVVRNKAMLRELLSASTVIDGSAMISSFAKTDSDYTVLYVDGNDAYWSTVPAYLFTDRIPEFLK